MKRSARGASIAACPPSSTAACSRKVQTASMPCAPRRTRLASSAVDNERELCCSTPSRTRLIARNAPSSSSSKRGSIASALNTSPELPTATALGKRVTAARRLESRPRNSGSDTADRGPKATRPAALSTSPGPLSRTTISSSSLRSAVTRALLLDVIEACVGAFFAALVNFWKKVLVFSFAEASALAFWLFAWLFWQTLEPRWTFRAPASVFLPRRMVAEQSGH